jgi:hypothetical protein
MNDHQSSSAGPVRGPASDGRSPDFDDPRNLIRTCDVRAMLAFQADLDRLGRSRKGRSADAGTGDQEGESTDVDS